MLQGREPSEPYLASSLVCEEGLVLAPPPPPPSSVLGLEAVFREVSKSSWRILSPIGATVFFLLNVQSPGNCVCLKHLFELLGYLSRRLDPVRITVSCADAVYL